MKKIIILTLFFLFLTQNVQASIFNFSTPNNRQNYKQHYHYPPKRPPKYYQNNNYSNYYPHNYNTYYKPPQKKVIFNSVGDFFSSGNITGITPPINNVFDNPYGYQKGYQDSDGNYYFENYSSDSGSSVKLLD